MVKAVNLVLGITGFSLVLTMMFAAVGDMMRLNNIEGSTQFDSLAGEYEGFANTEAKSNSTARQIIGGTSQGSVTSEEKANFLVTGAISGGKLAVNFFTNFDDIIIAATNDANSGENYIDSRLVFGMLGLLAIVLSFLLIIFLRGFKMET